MRTSMQAHRRIQAAGRNLPAEYVQLRCDAASPLRQSGLDGDELEGVADLVHDQGRQGLALNLLAWQTNGVAEVCRYGVHENAAEAREA